MKHKQAILKACALYYGKHRDQTIPAQLLEPGMQKMPNQQLGMHKSIVMPSTEPSIVQA